jgi:hypothetical protein
METEVDREGRRKKREPFFLIPELRMLHVLLWKGRAT